VRRKIHPTPPFENKRGLIYGPARGIGRAVALEFARRDAELAIADIDVAGAEGTATDVIKMGGRAIGLTCDVLSDEAVRATAAEAERRLGELDIPMSEWLRILSLNLLSVVRSLDVFLPKMISRGRGYIVNTASFAGLYPYATNRMPYVASKAAVNAWPWRSVQG
jgi:NAD(P)-dependent dehydrogenase (short-subunit alcohol dehydrogenase family)